MTEEDTFKALTRKPFREVIYDNTHVGESISAAYRYIVLGVAAGELTQRYDWEKYSGGWTWPDFKAECIKRSKLLEDTNAIRDF